MRPAACFLIPALTLLLTSHCLAQGSCGPSSLGQPCAQGGLAVAGHAEAGLNLGAGNPVHLVTGNKYQQEPDLPAHPMAPGLEIVRHYNSQDRRPSVLGQGWSLSYDTRLFFAANLWQIVQADGSRVAFAATKDQPLPNAHGTLSRDGATWLWTWPTGRKLWFDAKGLLLRIQSGRDIPLEIHRHDGPGPMAGTVASIRTGQRHSLAFGYQVLGSVAYLSHIDTPLGRFKYEYETATTPNGIAPHRQRLKTLTRPDGMQRHYLYEAKLQSGNAYALTGIETAWPERQQKQRSNTWAYDAQSRAILSVRGDPDSQDQRLAIAYVQAATPQQSGLTVVTQARGEQTRFEFAIKGARHVLTAVSGAPCPGCAAPGSHAAYDERGRLRIINGTHIQRDAAGHIQALEPRAPGWPVLALAYQGNGYRSSWSSTLTGQETQTYDARRLPLQRRFANGDSTVYRYDEQGRPLEVQERNADRSLTTALQWRGKNLAGVSHPHENETRHYGPASQLLRRTIERPTSATGTSLRYTEGFVYDKQQRLQQHQLPEGGSLHYQWSGKRLTGISWQDAQGQLHPVIGTVRGQGGYRYGNGLHLQSALDARRRLRQLIVTDSTKPVWTLNLAYDRQGRLQREQHDIPAIGHRQTSTYAYDAQSRLIGAQTDTQPADDPQAATTRDIFWYAWHDDGSQAARRVNGATSRPVFSRDASGLSLALDDSTLAYGPDRRLAEVRRHGAPLARYLHNAFGHRVLSRNDKTSTDYFYLDNRMVAESRHETSAIGVQAVEPAPKPRITRRYIHAHQVLVGIIDYASPGTLYFVHGGPVGEPRLVSDATKAIRWASSYTPTGSATRIAGDLELDLRLPGQVHDGATGWHDNLLRTYLPELGQYLEPDPLGPVPGHQALGYALQQPRRHIDPSGLLLFAFDGTRNSAETQSNVWKMSQYYLDGPVYYHSGPGNSLYLDWDAAIAWRADKIIETQWLSLLNALDSLGSLQESIPIDILGFSRGAALARHFGNLIDQHVDRGLFSYMDSVRGLVTACVDLRFMGLFDTVAQFGVAGSQNSNYDLSIASAWQWVAHAVALHERRWLFPLTSVGDGGALNTIEAPFIGAHADIGGGVLLDDDGQPSSRGDLADVSLNWMLWQARASSLHFGSINEKDREITDPILHDQRMAALRYVQDGDRGVDAANGSSLHQYQDDHEKLGREQRLATEALIQRKENWLLSGGSEVGQVDMRGYAQWLQEELGWQALPA